MVRENIILTNSRSFDDLYSSASSGYTPARMLSYVCFGEDEVLRISFVTPCEIKQVYDVFRGGSDKALLKS